MDPLKVSAKSSPNAVAGAIAAEIEERNYCEATAIGAGANNQLVKAVAIARGYCAPSGKDLVCIPVFDEVTIDGDERTRMHFYIEPRNGPSHAPAPVIHETTSGAIGLPTPVNK